MLFNSYEFMFLFLPLTFAGYFALGHWRLPRAALGWLTLASFFFYGWWDVRYVPLLMGSIVFNFLAGRRIEAARKKKLWLTAAVLGNLLLLGYFKYMGFFLATVDAVTGSGWVVPHIVLPLGISFFTFTQTAYLIDAYRGETRRYSFLNYCLFVTIFPHLIAGPIINHRAMIPQFSRLRNFVIDYRNLAQGLCLFTMGLFKKVVIADQLSPWVNAVFAQASSVTFYEAWAGALGYTFQLYFDFSGYSEMAIGLGLMFNLHFPVNFNSPYQADSIIDFWRRWHMTLGGWVKNYLYIPLGGNRHGEWHRLRNLLVSMLLIGLWHGAGWTYVFWGGLHGVCLVINHTWRRLGVDLPQGLCRLVTFLSVVIAWVFFRADSFADAGAVLSGMLRVQDLLLPSAGLWRLADPVSEVFGWLAVLMAGLMVCQNPLQWLRGFRTSWTWLAVSLALGLLSLYSLSHVSDFLYFQF